MDNSVQKLIILFVEIYEQIDVPLTSAMEQNITSESTTETIFLTLRAGPNNIIQRAIYRLSDLEIKNA